MLKITETLGDAVKLAANLTEAKKDKKDEDICTTQQSNPNQTVQIQMTHPEKTEKKEPVIIHEKPETHIHKEFPDERALTDAECDLALKKAQMEYELKLKQMEHDNYIFEEDRVDRIKREALDRKEREEKRIRNEKKAKVRTIVGGIFAALGIGAIGYAMYTDYRDHKQPSVISAEGKVE